MTQQEIIDNFLATAQISLEEVRSELTGRMIVDEACKVFVRDINDFLAKRASLDEFRERTITMTAQVKQNPHLPWLTSMFYRLDQISDQILMLCSLDRVTVRVKPE